MDVDFAPNRDFSPFPNRQEQELRENKVQTEITQNYDVLKEIIEHLDESIEHYKTLNTSLLSLTLTPKKHAIAVRANIQTAQFLSAERNYIQGLIDTFKR